MTAFHRGNAVSRYVERIVHVPASPAEVFVRLDEQTRDDTVAEVVTERIYPRRKAWRRTDPASLLVMDGYTMGYEVSPEDGGSRLKVWIDYALPARWLAQLPARIYARWRVDDLAQDAADSFTDMAVALAAHP
jgi:hypothetical protein